ncbi:MAG: hypothetical protein QM638_07335 [Nocardioides sp.]|uniref:phospholipase D-like domain-containing protein n=1 Tax=Nocardioides sp. TaxID=35761 RepID=UPI0039E59137
MSAPEVRRPRRTGLRSTLRRAALAAATTTAVLAPLAIIDATSVTSAPQLAASSTYVAPKIRIVQANMKSNQPVGHFQADVKTVLAQHPDIVTYNEVGYRYNVVLAPGRYRIWRTPGRFKGETAVAWDSRKWKLLDKGTRMVSDKHGKTKHQTVQWGIRYANWVTLRSRSTGRTISVVAAHTAPRSAVTDGLLKPSVRRIAKLVGQLADRGPVVVGGDFNVAYHSSLYPRSLLTKARMVPTYDVIGKNVATGNHHGNTIDYLFVRGVARFAMGNQRAISLHSDHNALAVDFAPMPSSTSASAVRFGAGTVMSDPRGAVAARRVVMRTVVKAINSAPRRATVHLATQHLRTRNVIKALRAAHRRGVHVQLITGDRHSTHVDRRFARLLGSNVGHKSWAVRRPTAFDTLPSTGLLVSKSGATPAFRVTATSALVPSVNVGVKRAWLSTSKSSYDALFRTFFAAVGRTVG